MHMRIQHHFETQTFAFQDMIHSREALHGIASGIPSKLTGSFMVTTKPTAGSHILASPSPVCKTNCPAAPNK